MCGYMTFPRTKAVPFMLTGFRINAPCSVCKHYILVPFLLEQINTVDCVVFKVYNSLTT